MSTQPAKTVIVTGGSRGIGKAIALRLAHDGFAVTIGYVGNHAQAQATLAAIRNGGGIATAVQGDIAEPEDVARLFTTATETFGRLDAVVSNAGILELARIEPDHVDALDRSLRTNVRGTCLVFAEAANALREGGRIVALSSSVVAKSFPGYGPYIASKCAVEGLVPVLANELRGRGITVNAVAPGPTATELFFAGKTDEQIHQLADMSPLQRLGQPSDVASVVSFLLGADAAWINAQILRVNGGYA